MEHAVALKKYLLLGQGDFIQSLMDSLGSDLDLPSNKLFKHNLVSVLETAIRASNAQYEPSEISSRLDVKLLPVIYQYIYLFNF
jgi:gamma-tubulin complex component 3